MENDASAEELFNQLTWRSGEASQPRLCTDDCYGSVHFDFFLMWRENNAPPILGNKDPRALLGARLFLENEGLGQSIVRDAIPVSPSLVNKNLYKPLVLAFLKTHEGIDVDNYSAQFLKVQYVRPVH